MQDGKARRALSFRVERKKEMVLEILLQHVFIPRWSEFVYIQWVISRVEDGLSRRRRRRLFRPFGAATNGGWI